MTEATVVQPKTFNYPAVMTGYGRGIKVSDTVIDSPGNSLVAYLPTEFETAEWSEQFGAIPSKGYTFATVPTAEMSDDGEIVSTLDLTIPAVGDEFTSKRVSHVFRVVGFTVDGKIKLKWIYSPTGYHRETTLHGIMSHYKEATPEDHEAESAMLDGVKATKAATKAAKPPKPAKVAKAKPEAQPEVEAEGETDPEEEGELVPA